MSCVEHTVGILINRLELLILCHQHDIPLESEKVLVGVSLRSAFPTSSQLLSMHLGTHANKHKSTQGKPRNKAARALVNNLTEAGLVGFDFRAVRMVFSSHGQDCAV